MEGVEFLLSKWDEMNNWKRALVLLLSLGAIAFALDQIFGFFYKWILPNIAKIQNLPDWIVSIILAIPFAYLLLIFLYTIITVYLVRRAQNTTKTNYREEITELVNLCKRLKDIIDKDNKEKQLNRLNKRKENNASNTVGAQMKKLQLLAGISLDTTTPEESLSIEAADVLKKYDK